MRAPLWAISCMRPPGTPSSRSFTSPLRWLCRSVRRWPIPRHPSGHGLARALRARKGGKDKGGKGKSTGKIQVGESWYDLVSKTPDGRELCYAYNIKSGCQVKGCQRVHACRVKGCQGSHPAYQHGSQGGS